MHALILTLATFFGLGRLPKAPGTWGTLGAIPLWWWLSCYGSGVFVAFTVVFAGFAIWVSHEAEKIYGQHDTQSIVIDEVAGMLVTVLFVPLTWGTLVAAFVLFRLLDAVKPPPIRQIDKHVGGGLGVVLDDLLAGAIGCGILHSAHLGLGAWW